MFPLRAIIQINSTFRYDAVGVDLVNTGSVLAIISPIYFFRHVFWKRSTETYFAMPIKRKTLFSSTFWFSQLVYVVPLYIIYYITFFIGMFDSDSTQDIIVYAGLIPLLLLILFLTISCITTWIVSFSNTLLDGIGISVGYVIFPYVFSNTVYNFLIKLYQIICIGDGSYVDEFPPFKIIRESLNIFWYGNALTYKMAKTIEDYHVSFWPLFLWAIAGGITWYWAKHNYMIRKQESSEQRTSKWYGYPLICIAYLSFIMLAIYTTTQLSTVILPTIVLFFVFIGVMCVFQRKIRVHLRHIGCFLCVLLCCFGLTQVMLYTKGFQLVKEVIQIDQAEDVVVSIQRDYAKNSNPLLTIVIGYDENGDVIEKKVEHISIHVKDKEHISELIDLQKKTIEVYEQLNLSKDAYSTIDSSFITFIINGEVDKDAERDYSNIPCYRSYHLPYEQMIRVYGDYIYQISAMQARGELNDVVSYEVYE